MQLIIQEKRIKRTLLLLFLTFLVYLLGFYPDFVENWYSLGFYPLFADFLRRIFGWLPFSLGDLLYFAIGCWILVIFIRFFLSFSRKKSTSAGLFQLIGSLLRFVCWTYLIFKLFWGLNYNRQGIASQLSIKHTLYAKEEVTALTRALIQKTNECRKRLPDTSLPVYAVPQIIQQAVNNYRILQTIYPFLQYDHPSVKSSMYSNIADYIGFTGYYAPLTGEAQLRTDIPGILLPYITCHEIAHQLGYASESEANFVGYLAASVSGNAYFNYSVYLDLLGYAQGQEFLLYAQDSSFKALEMVLDYNRTHIDSLVKKDRKEIRRFFMERSNKIAPVSADLYDQYLKFNKQLRGINSYDEVIGWLIAYSKKRGRI